MQVKIKSSLPSVLLLAFPGAVFATPEVAEPVRYVKASAMGMSKRNSFMLDIQPQYMAMPLGENSLVKRQSCGSTAKPCYNGCCNIGTVCGIYGGEEGCCPIGKNCNSVSGCQDSDDVYCETYCCPSGTTCAVDSTGEGTCSKGGNDDTGNDDTGGQCEVGYSACAQFDGCCPTGTRCVLPKNCDIPCASDDPKCGTGCCPKGSYCTSEETCEKDSTDSFTSLVQNTKTSRIIKTTTIDYSTETTTDYLPTETTDLSSPTDGDSYPTYARWWFGYSSWCLWCPSHVNGPINGYLGGE
ncbi:hypothetical protein L211DRAFT_363354 [Terfezia boudieri ATCC MYA-4762]|uniref:Granulins domain-containing protein n=1 Tax=Terfezia boudieri ATCC MYA-4762 TaxID=1051890 RepID=A0A3N4M2R7_9PEZI|nr:hypothetical protein L211DRAFT_363354 [Terfezia boudieri ATCC MYA-4762]